MKCRLQDRIWDGLIALAMLFAGSLATGAETAQVDYNQQIRSILSNHCFACHGPDAAERQAGLRLDLRSSAIAAADSGKRVIVPGDSGASELVRRISSDDPDIQMPPPDANKQLSAADKELLIRWIAQGAKYEQHWAFVPPVRSRLPKSETPKWARNTIDRFIAAQWQAAGLTHSPEASRAALIRRVTLDLTGLPPSLDEVDTFVADDHPDAYERLIDRLMATPQYGERMALDWLDAARFADTHGYHIDSGRDMTRWREYVISAFNRDLPYDQFTVEQLAGDLLPETDNAEQNLRQKVASGFNRNHMINFEGGAIPQEYLHAYIVDRVNTTGTVFLGLTVACTQCHDHKFDLLTQREFYQLYAFFNNVPEKGLDGSKGNAEPLLKTPPPFQRAELDNLAAQIEHLEKQLAGPLPDVEKAQATWERTALQHQREAWNGVTKLQAKSLHGAQFETLADQSLLAVGDNPPTDTYELRFTTDLAPVTGLRLETLPDDHFKSRGPGRSVNGNIVLTNVRVARETKEGAREIPIKRASADFSQQDFPIANAIDADPKTGWAIHPQVGQPHAAVFELERPLEPSDDTFLVTLEFHSKFGQHQLGRFRLSLTGADNPHTAAALPEKIIQLLKQPADQQSPAQQSELRSYYRTHVSSQTRQMQERLAKLTADRTALENAIPTTMVMRESPQPRETHILLRGEYDKPGESVSPDVPSVLPPLPAGAPLNRLGLAQWLVDPQHPLLGRVTVNRYWQMFFGTGLVKTAEDFGSQGEPPSHPELLDWLAVEFISADRPAHDGWEVKRLVRDIVTSATYRQSSMVAPAHLERDPENRLLARGPRFRLQAEMIRDQALFHSGLLDGRIGGKSVSPYQPPGIWEELASREDGAKWTAQVYRQDHGADLYRRTMYTFWKRTAPPPSLVTLDAPDRETCTVRRARTNTPLQALVLMNDPTYIEAARKFAERILCEEGETLDAKLQFAFRSVLTRPATAAELTVLRQVYNKQMERFTAHPEAAQKLLAIGEAPADASLPAAELATWTIVASTILNTDEALTKG